MCCKRMASFNARFQKIMNGIWFKYDYIAFAQTDARAWRCFVNTGSPRYARDDGGGGYKVIVITVFASRVVAKQSSFFDNPLVI